MGSSVPPLERRIGQFDIQGAILRDGIAELSSKSIDGLHLGLEEIIRNKIQDDPRTLNVHFSLHLNDTTVKEILNALAALIRATPGLPTETPLTFFRSRLLLIQHTCRI